MKTLFPGYFTPTEEEFAKLWNDCQFAFDANVLLGLYRSTAETQEVFFNVLEKVADRVFLPHQAASEYLKNRLGVISFRSDQYGKIKGESDKLAKQIEDIVQQHAIHNGEEIAKTTKRWAQEIRDLVEAAAEGEPDLLRSDDVLSRLSGLFETKTGPPYPPSRLKEIYAEGAQRYSQGVPPGYKDDKKREPDKYGDLLIWFQLIDQAKAQQKPIIFITGDAKEDWLLDHGGEALGPRPELRQEMMAAAGVHFYTYTTPRFLEFAKQFLGLALDTAKAESEFEKIQKQDKQAAEWDATPQANYHFGFGLPANQTWQSWGGSYHYPGYKQPINFGWGAEDYVPWTPPVDSPAKTKFFALLPINGLSYNSSTGRWKCEIASHPESVAEVHACYGLKFEPENRARGERHLKVWVSVLALEHDTGWEYKTAISRAITRWLDGNQVSGEISLLS